MIFEHGMCGSNPLHCAETEQEVLKIIDRYGTSSMNMFGDTALHYASSKEIAMLLIEDGADVNCKNLMGMTPLHYAFSDEVALTLILNGAEVNSKSSMGVTPLHMSMEIKTSRVLIEHGADVNIRSNCGETPLHMAPTISIIQLLVDNGADIETKDLIGMTPLMNSCYCMNAGIFGSGRIIKRFIELGADVNSTNNTGNGLKEIMGDKYPFIEKLQCERTRRELVSLRNLYKRKNHLWEEGNICNQLITHNSDDIFRNIVGFI